MFEFWLSNCTSNDKVEKTIPHYTTALLLSKVMPKPLVLYHHRRFTTLNEVGI